MEAQLRLLSPEHRSAADPAERRSATNPEAPEAPASWRIDESTRAVGRSGLALARAALDRAHRPLPRSGDPDTTHSPAAA